MRTDLLSQQRWRQDHAHNKAPQLSKLNRFARWVLLPQQYRYVGLKGKPSDLEAETLSQQLSRRVGAILLGVATSLAMVCCAPTVPFNMAAGALFGVANGTLIVLAGMITGSALSFLLARYYFKDYAEHCMESLPVFSQSSSNESTLTDHGFVISTLLRLCPLLPAGAVSYSLGATPISLADFVCGSAVGQVVIVYLFCSLGFFVRKLSSEKKVLRRAAIRLSVGGTAASIIAVGCLASFELTSFFRSAPTLLINSGNA
eukprot:gene4506-6983_t